MERARHYGAIARDALAIFPDCDPKAALLDAVAFCVEPAVLDRLTSSIAAWSMRPTSMGASL